MGHVRNLLKAAPSKLPSQVCVCVCGVCGGLGCLTLFSSLTMCGDHCDRKDFIVAFRPLW